LLKELKDRFIVLRINKEIFGIAKEIVEEYRLVVNDALIAAIA